MPSIRSTKQRKPRSSWLGWYVLSIVLVLGLFAAYFFIYVADNEAHLTNYYHRLLSTAGSNIQTTIERQHVRVKRAGEQATPGYVLAALEKISGLSNIRGFPSSHTLRIPADANMTSEKLSDEKGMLYTTVHRAGGQAYIEFAIDCDSLVTKDRSDPTKFTAQMKLQSNLGPVLPVDVFDTIVLLEGNKRLFQVGDRGPKLLALPSNEEDGGELDYSATLVTDSEIAGTGYKLFIQPLTVPSQLLKDDGAIDEEQPVWVLAGLATKNKFRAQTMAVRPAVLVAVAFILVLGALGLPYLRIRYAGIRDGLRAHEMIVLAIAYLLGSAIATLAVSHAVADREGRQGTEDALGSLAFQIRKALELELNQAQGQLDSLTKARADISPLSKPGFDVRTGTQAVGSVRPMARRVRLLNSERGTLNPYPFLNMAYWMDPLGRQVEKWSVDSTTTAPVPVGDREYFKHARDGPLWSSGDVVSLPDRFVESIRSKTTGAVYAVLSSPFEAGPDSTAVQAILTPLLSVIHPTLPPDHDFCIIDRTGLVLFHSKDERNLQENFFEESDLNRSLVAGVFLRSNEWKGTLTYRGRQIRAYMIPMAKQGGLQTPWFLLTFTDSQQLRTFGLDLVTLTLVVLLFYLILLILLSAWLQLSFKTERRAGEARRQWYWPTVRRRVEYARCNLGLVTLATGGLVLLLLGRDSLSAMTWITYALAAPILVYSVVTRRGLRLRTAGWLLGLAILGLVLWQLGQPIYSLVVLGFALIAAVTLRSTGAMFWILVLCCAASSGTPFPCWEGFVAALSMAIALFLARSEGLGVPTEIVKGMSTAESFKSSYLWGLVLFHLIVAVYPTVGCYRVLSDECFRLYAKRSQVLTIEALQARETQLHERYKRIAMSDECEEQMKQILFPDNLAGAPGLYLCRSDAITYVDTMEKPDAKSSRQDAITHLNPAVPLYSRLSAELRQLTSHSASGSAWSWLDQNGQIVLNAQGIGQGTSLGAGRPIPADRTSIQVRTTLPPSPLPRPWFPLILTLLAAAAFYVTLQTLLRKVFLWEMEQPRSGRYGSGARHRLILRPSKRVRDWHLSRFPPNATYSTHRIRLADVGEILEDFKKHEPAEILLPDFECGLDEPVLLERKLSLLEAILATTKTRIRILSDVDPLYVLSTRAEDRWARQQKSSVPLERWARVFEQFVKLRPPERADNMRERRYALWQKLRREHGISDDRGKRLASEGWAHPALRVIVRRLARLSDVENYSEDQIVEIVLDQAMPYYRRLWAYCSTEERVLLHRLAREGFVNWQMKDTLQSLIRRRLVVQHQNFRLINESFRRFALGAEPEQQIQEWEREAGPGRWSQVKIPVIVAVFAAGIFLFATQRDVLQQGVTILGVLATAGPALFKLVTSMLSGQAGPGTTISSANDS